MPLKYDRMVYVKVDKDLEKRLDVFRRRQEAIPVPTLSDTIRTLLDEALANAGLPRKS